MTDISATHVVPSRSVADRAARTRLAYLDGWRGLSIALVLIGHFFPVPGINLGVLGVEFFFVLSGRLMGEILFVERYPLKKFFKRRFSRIYPALLVFVVVSMIALSGTFIAFKWKAALTALTFTYNYAGILVTRAGALDHIWSLCVEEHAYIILALISVVVSSRTRVVVLLAGAGLACHGQRRDFVLGLRHGLRNHLLAHRCAHRVDPAVGVDLPAQGRRQAAGGLQRQARGAGGIDLRHSCCSSTRCRHRSTISSRCRCWRWPSTRSISARAI